MTAPERVIEPTIEAAIEAAIEAVKPGWPSFRVPGSIVMVVK